MTNKYELTVVLYGKAGSAKKKKITETLESLMKVFKGKIAVSTDWGVKDLAYKIQKLSSGLYLYFELELDGVSTKALNEKLRVDGDVLRYLLIRKD